MSLSINGAFGNAVGNDALRHHHLFLPVQESRGEGKAENQQPHGAGAD